MKHRIISLCIAAALLLSALPWTGAAAAPAPAEDQPTLSGLEAGTDYTSGEILVLFDQNTLFSDAGAQSADTSGDMVLEDLWTFGTETPSVTRGAGMDADTGLSPMQVGLYRSKTLSTQEMLDVASAMPEVAVAEPNYIWSMCDSDSGASAQGSDLNACWQLQQIHADAVWSAGKGSVDKAIVILDTGIHAADYPGEFTLWDNPWSAGSAVFAAHPSLKKLGAHGYNYADGTTDTQNGDMHGTRVAACAGAATQGGVLEHVPLIDMKVYAGTASTLSYSTVLMAYADVEAMCQSGVEIGAINGSFGGFSADARILLSAIERLGSGYGVLSVYSAGNNRVDTDAKTYYPAGLNSNYILSVGAVKENGTVTYNYGKTSVDLAAPGSDVWALGTSISGTSFSAPMVAAAVALLKSLYPDASGLELRQKLLACSRPTLRLQNCNATNGILDMALLPLVYGDGDEVPIDAYRFPDSTLRLFAASCDTDGNGKLSKAERSAVTSISLGNHGIASLAGVSFFPNLVSLDCTGNALTSLDLSSNPMLTSLRCDGNRMPGLELAANTRLSTVTAGTQTTERQSIFYDQTAGYYYLDLTALVGAGNEGNVTNVSGGTYSAATGWITLPSGSAGSVSYTYVLKNTSQTMTVHVPFSDFSDVHLDSTTFPDPVFLQFVSAYDTNDDGYLSQTESAKVLSINVSSKGISSLEGIGTFSALETLICNDNALESLDLSKNTALSNLLCTNNQLTALDVHANPKLSILNCGGNKLASLNLSSDSSRMMYICGSQTTPEQTIAYDVDTDSYYVDLAALVGQENLSRVSGLSGGSLDKSTGLVTLPSASATSLSYTYTTNDLSDTMEVTVPLAFSSGLQFVTDTSYLTLYGAWRNMSTWTISVQDGFGNPVSGASLTWKAEKESDYGFSQPCVSVDGQGTLTVLRSGICEVTATRGSESVSIVVVVPGDYNRDGAVNTADATWAIDVACEDQALDSRPYSQALIDMDGSGRINLADATTVIDLAVGDLVIS